MQKTIYIKDAELWESIRVQAGRQGLSISAYLVWLHRSELSLKEKESDHA